MGLELSTGRSFEVGSELGPEFFRERCHVVAESLVGKLLVNEVDGVAGVIVETEAYMGEDDPACHLSNGDTERNQVFFKGPGTVYVFVIHGHDNLNFITEHRGHPGGVLIRAVEPVKEVEKMKKRRGKTGKKLTDGPGKLTEAFNISKKQHNGQSIDKSPITVRETSLELETAKTERIGISDAEHWELRYIAEENRYVSKNMETKENYSQEVQSYYS
ncbi:MAG: DNA-3-methyladenine glycosylase [Candidatus Nanohalobium sp.]